MYDRYDISEETKKEIKSELRGYCEKLKYHFISEEGKKVIYSVLNKYGFEDYKIEKVLNKALSHTENETHQAMEALVHNLNSIK